MLVVPVSVVILARVAVVVAVVMIMVLVLVFVFVVGMIHLGTVVVPVAFVVMVVTVPKARTNGKRKNKRNHKENNEHLRLVIMTFGQKVDHSLSVLVFVALLLVVVAVVLLVVVVRPVVGGTFLVAVVVGVGVRVLGGTEPFLEVLDLGAEGAHVPLERRLLTRGESVQARLDVVGDGVHHDTILLLSFLSLSMTRFAGRDGDVVSVGEQTD